MFICFPLLLASESKVRAWILFNFVLGTKEMFVESRATWHQSFALSHVPYLYHGSGFWHEVQREQFAATLFLRPSCSYSSSRPPSTLFFPIPVPVLGRSPISFLDGALEKLNIFSHLDSLKKKKSSFLEAETYQVSEPFGITVPFN